MIQLDTPDTLGTQVLAARKRLSLIQSELALAAGVGVRFIVDLEAGKPTLRLAQVLRVIDALGCKLMLDGLEGFDAAPSHASETSHDA